MKNLPCSFHMRGQTFQVSAPCAKKIIVIIIILQSLIMRLLTVACRWFSPDNSLFLQCHSLALLTFHPAKKTNDEQGLQHHPGAGKRVDHFRAQFSVYSSHKIPVVDLSLINTALSQTSTQNQTVFPAQVSSFRPQIILVLVGQLEV